MNNCLVVLALQCALRAGVGPAPVAQPMASFAPVMLAPIAFVADTPVTPVRRRRPHAVEYSDWYARRLMVHRIGSYVMLPMFAAEYYLGDRLLNGTNVPEWTKSAHGVVAGGVATLFTVNTLTGAWNLWDSRNDPAGRTRKWIHSGLMLASDAGFVATGLLADDDAPSSRLRLHRNVAVGSMALSALGTGMMWLWRD